MNSQNHSRKDSFQALKSLTQDQVETSQRAKTFRGKVIVKYNKIAYLCHLFGEDDLLINTYSKCLELSLRIQAAVEAHDPYFREKRNAAGKLGLSSLQKITASLRMLAYGVTADFMDEYVRIGESTAITSLKKFTRAIISIFGAEYLRSPNGNDIARLLAIGENRGFPGMLGSIDCMHWKWKNCPSALKGMYTGHIHEPTLILEAVASYDLWIWHALFGMPGALNDINVLDRSNVFSELTQGRAPAVDFYVNGNQYSMGYYLADGIYPSWTTFVKTIPAPQNNKTKQFGIHLASLSLSLP
ncbi:uncharacterized protein LOC120007265 [Tripterygium wilfordii]|uniref:uncharacterized protein LOC120007265 n=1 Tax=Tripterygium wilfordii TaxID=458696 RepID=UPI0018F825E4|nr:uncharacterized protein LOC120007265 [Tripterygium wilfordii]